METNLQHEDLLIKLRAKLNEEKIKLWEPPYTLLDDGGISKSLQELAKKYSNELSVDIDTVFGALHELQQHSIERSKANAQFKETGFATFRIKATVPGQKPKVLNVQKKLDTQGGELIKEVAEEIGVSEKRVKLIANGKVIKPTLNLEEQGVRNGSQIMGLIMAESPEEVKEEDKRFLELKSTRDDAMLLSEYVEDIGDDDEYMKLEDQSGKTVELPPIEKKALMVGLALHERGRAAAKQREYPLALLLLLEADRHLSECSSSILKSVDNWAVLQLDIAWCYLCLQSLASASDAAARLARAEQAFNTSYGEDHQRLIALKGTAANERVLLMRLYLLQGIVAYHQNKRAEAKALLEKAENEMNFLRVDEEAVTSLMELGWSRGQARAGLRAAGGDLDRAHHYLDQLKAERDRAREKHRQDRERRLLGLCVDGSEVKKQLVEALVGMGYTRRLATVALRNSNNHVAEAVRLIQEQPELLEDTDSSSDEQNDETSAHSSEESQFEVDSNLVAELTSMGYEAEQAAAALRMARNDAPAAVGLLVAGAGQLVDAENSGKPSTSSAAPTSKVNKRQKKHKRDKKKEKMEEAFKRLQASIRSEEDDHLDTELMEEQQFLAQYKCLL